MKPFKLIITTVCILFSSSLFSANIPLNYDTWSCTPLAGDIVGETTLRYEFTPSSTRIKILFNSSFLGIVRLSRKDLSADGKHDITVENTFDGNEAVIVRDDILSNELHYLDITYSASTYPSGPAKSDFTICVTKLRPPANDQPSGAELIVQSYDCNEKTSSLTGAFSGYENHDVWYKFVALSTNVTVTVNSDFTERINLFSDSDPNFSTPITTLSNGVNYSSNISVGDTLYISIGDNILNSLEDLPFTFCITQLKPDLVDLSTVNTDNITINSAVVNGKININGNTNTSELGFCFSENSSPTTADTKVVVASNLQSFSSTLSNLKLGTTYYVRSFATNSKGTSYGEELVFTTLSFVKPSVNTMLVDNVTPTGADITAEVINTGNAPISETGVIFTSVNNNFKVTSWNKETTSVTNGTYKITRSGMSSLVVFYSVAYIITEGDTIFGDAISFTTKRAYPEVSYGLSSDVYIETTTIEVGLYIDGKDDISTTAGVYYSSTNPSPTSADNTAFTTTSGSYGYYYGYLTGLTPGTKYYIVPFVINESGEVVASTKTYTTLGSSSAEKVNQQNSSEIYPNPITIGEQLQVVCENCNVEFIKIVDINGKLFFHGLMKNIFVRDFNAGIYTVLFYSSQGLIKTEKLIVQK